MDYKPDHTLGGIYSERNDEEVIVVHAREFAGGDSDSVPLCVVITQKTRDEEDAIGRRIVACVNACTGISDPSAAMEMVRLILRDVSFLTGSAYRIHLAARAEAAISALGGGKA